MSLGDAIVPGEISEAPEARPLEELRSCLFGVGARRGLERWPLDLGFRFGRISDERFSGLLMVDMFDVVSGVAVSFFSLYEIPLFEFACSLVVEDRGGFGMLSAG